MTTPQNSKDKWLELLSKIIEMWRESTFIQGSLTIVTVTSWIGMMIFGNNPPENLTNVVLIVVGFYFGSKSQQSARSMVKEVMQNSELNKFSD